MFKVCFVSRAGRQNYYAGLRLVGRHRCKCIPKVGKVRRQLFYLQAVKQFGEDACHCHPVLQCISRARRGLRPIVQYPHFSIGATGNVGGVEYQLVLGHLFQPCTFSQEARVIIHKFYRQQSILDELLGTIDVFQYQVE